MTWHNESERKREKRCIIYIHLYLFDFFTLFEVNYSYVIHGVFCYCLSLILHTSNYSENELSLENCSSCKWWANGTNNRKRINNRRKKNWDRNSAHEPSTRAILSSGIDDEFILIFFFSPLFCSNIHSIRWPVCVRFLYFVRVFWVEMKTFILS